MTQSSGGSSPLHVAIIMDGNGRWAQQRGRPREWGHRNGAETVRRIVEAAPDLGIGVLTLYAFSSDNWSRPDHEVTVLMKLFSRYLASETTELAEKGVRLRVVGRRDRLARRLVRSIESAEAATAHGQRLTLRLAVDYSSRDVFLRAVRSISQDTEIDRTEMAKLIGEAMNGLGPTPDVDLLIRTGGERRLSDFLLWESAYAELYFTPVMWPDFTSDDLALALEDFRARDRRYGKVAAAAAS